MNCHTPAWHSPQPQLNDVLLTSNCVKILKMAPLIHIWKKNKVCKLGANSLEVHKIWLCCINLIQSQIQEFCDSILSFVLSHCIVSVYLRSDSLHKMCDHMMQALPDLMSFNLDIWTSCIMSIDSRGQSKGNDSHHYGKSRMTPYLWCFHAAAQWQVCLSM